MMPESEQVLESRLEELAQQVQALTTRVEGMAEEIRVLSAGGKGTSSPQPQGQSPDPLNQVDAAVAQAKSMEQWTVATLPSSIATICFLLAIALGLRTIVDRVVINQLLGALIGMAYAGSLIAIGYRRHARGGALVPVYTVGGALLLFVIVLETHRGFGVIAAPPAYGILATVLLILTVMGLRFKASAPLCTGVLGATLAGMALEFPDPHFHYLATLLLVATGSAYFAVRLPRSRWLIWSVLMVTMVFWLMWTLKARASFTSSDPPHPGLALSWFLPILLVYAGGYIAMVARSALRENRTFGALEALLTAAIPICAYSAAKSVVVPWRQQEGAANAAGLAVAILFIVVASFLAGKGTKGKRAAASVVLGALILFAVSLSSITSDARVTPFLCSLAALGVALMGVHYLSWRLKTLGLAFQIFAVIAAVGLGLFHVGVDQPFIKATVAAILAIICLAHYGTILRALTPEKKASLSPPHILLIILVVVCAFGAARITLYTSVAAVQAEPSAIFEGGQSILINAGALVLLLLGLWTRREDIAIVGVIAAVCGAVKVFGYDLILAHTQGLPLALSVASFGITAAGGSFVRVHWQPSPNETTDTLNNKQPDSNSDSSS